MQPPLVVLLIYCVLVTGSSLLGGWLPTLLNVTHTRMQLLMSYLGGLLMGVALLHLLPHSIVQFGSVDPAAGATVIGLVVMLIMVRCFHCHQHDIPESARSECAHDHCHTHDHDAHSHDHDHDHGHAAAHQHGHGEAVQTRSRYGWIGLFFGLGLHTLMDGIALGASVAAEGNEGMAAAWAGLGTFLAVALHKPLDSMSITLLMNASGWRGLWPSVINVLYSLLCPLGAFLFFFGVRHMAGQSTIVGWALGLSAGVFLCIALVDVLPEIQFHSHHRIQLSTALFLGVVTAYAIGLAEPNHAHEMEGHSHGTSHQHRH
jgi:zinc and cadmium transporter